MVFSGTTSTDFMKLGKIPDIKKQQYIDYAGTDFYSLRNDLIGYIKAVYPEDYQNFSESDLGMMLIEVVAYMGSVVSLKSDMLANENYLRTVKSRDNLKKLLELIGVDMRGPLAAQAGAKLTLVEPPAAAAEFPLTFTANSRVFSVPSKEDGAPVNYTLYKVQNNTIKNIENTQASFDLLQSECDNPDASSVFSNLALLEGAFVVQQGIFDTLEGNKSVNLTDSPIVDGSIQVYINAGQDSAANGAYTQVERLYSASGANDRIFQSVYDDNYGATILFGDNAIGISPPAGAEFTVVYRTGGGTRGNIMVGGINVETSPTKPDSTVAVCTTENRTPATGGASAETAAHAKKYAPYTFKRQDRIVTLEDFIAVGNTFRSSVGTIGKTTAVVRDAYSSANIIDMYTLEKATPLTLQKATTVFKQGLLAAIEPKKMLTDEVVVLDGLIRTLDLVVTVRIDKALKPLEAQIQQEVSNAILTFFHIDNTDFGKAFVAGELSRKLFELPSIRFATIDNMPEVTDVDFNEIIQLNNFTINSIFV